ncbi:Hypothetical predicted protein [Cloeon dipterum]|uniref:SOCS box domain-containing protein n=1 Tax=Cloeon dipterum TaxID=197152 RepID=A0A8S1C712_9INSE|nr:Hypothetical predicted protein [Cloeon dipterum]
MRKILAKDGFALERRDLHSAHELTPLQSAVKYGHHRCVQFLLDLGADHTLRTRDNKNDLLELAVWGYSNESVIKLLLDFGLSPNFKSVENAKVRYNKAYYLTCAMRSGISAAQILLDYGAVINDFVGYSINFNNCEHFVASFNAVIECKSDILKFLLLNGAPVDARQARLPDNADPVSKDCLSLIHHFVCSNGEKGFDEECKILNLLHQFGANLWERNRLGLTPLQVRSNRPVWNRERHLRDMDWYVQRPNEGVFFRTTEYLRHLMSAPLSLSSLSRLTIIRTMSMNYFRDLHKLPPLPRKVMAYLRCWELLDRPIYEIY